MFEKFFGRKKNDDPKDLKAEKVQPSSTKKEVASSTPKDVGNNAFKNVTSADKQKAQGVVTSDKKVTKPSEVVELHSGYISPYAEEKHDKKNSSMDVVKADKKAATESFPVSNFEPLKKEENNAIVMENNAAVSKVPKTEKPEFKDITFGDSKERPIFTDDEKTKGNGKGVINPNSKSTFPIPINGKKSSEDPFFKARSYMNDAVVLVFLQDGIFKDKEKKVLLRSENIADIFLKNIPEKYFKEEVLKFSFGGSDTQDFVNVGENLVEVFKYIKSLDINDMKIPSKDNKISFNTQKCVQVIILGDGDISKFSEEDINFMKYAIEKLIQAGINTYFITSNKYTFADLAMLGFRNVEGTDHEYNIK